MSVLSAEIDIVIQVEPHNHRQILTYWCGTNAYCQCLPVWHYTTMANVQAVLSALDIFTRAPEKAALDQANSWLQDFQHSVITLYAFGTTTTSNALLLSV